MIYYVSRTVLKYFQITLVKQAVHPKFTPEVETDIYISDNSNIELNKCFESAKEPQFSTLTIQLTNHLLIVSVQYTGIGEFYTNFNIKSTYLFLKKKKKRLCHLVNHTSSFLHFLIL